MRVPDEIAGEAVPDRGPGKNLDRTIRRLLDSLGRKPLDAMRWEELWDAALRIRSAFLRAAIPDAIAEQIRRGPADHIGDGAVAVRSSAPGEFDLELA